jgi:hypothetical protein
VALVDDLLAGQADGLAEAQPGLDAAGVVAVAVVVEDALDPARRTSRSGQLDSTAASFWG